MDAKEFLKQYETAELLVDQLRTEYEKESEKVDAIRSALGGDGTPGSKEVSKSVERQAIKLAEKAEELKEAEIEALIVRQYVYSVIRDVPDVLGAILYERYINLKDWESVAYSVGYSKSRTHDLHKDALALVQNRIESDSTR